MYFGDDTPTLFFSAGCQRSFQHLISPLTLSVR
jgi:hypothetical protein